MVGLPAMDAAHALADLVEVSSQIEGAVMTDAKGAPVASTFDDDRAKAVAAAAHGLLAQAAESKAGSGAGLSHLVAELPDGAVFVVRDDERAIAAVTAPDPTVGLIVYDLKTCLRLASEGDDAKPTPKAKAKRPAAAKKAPTREQQAGAGARPDPKKADA